MNLHANQLAGKAIVSVEANGVHATAFFISPTQLLTARHFVIDAEVEEGEKDVINFVVDDVKHYCTYCEIADRGYDVVLLTTQSYCQQKDFCIELLATEMIPNQKLVIIGYPKELGNNIDYFSVNVENYKDCKEFAMGFDILVRRTEDSIFQSYKGFSGSPVLNQCNQAVGIVTDQFSSSLGYMSLYRMSNALASKDVKVSKDAEAADDRNIGLYSSRALVEHSIQKASSRYNDELHQENKQLTYMLDTFLNRQYVNPYNQIWDRLDKWFRAAGDEFSRFPRFNEALKQLKEKRHTKISFEEIRRLVIAKNPEVNLLDKDDQPNENFLERLKEIGYDLFDIEQTDKDYQTQFLCVSGSAGTGKTHLLCHYAKEYSSYSHTYLMFGSDFIDGGKDAFDQILEFINMTETEFSDLNDLLEEKLRYGLIVIDALNEGAGQDFWKRQMPTLVSKVKQYPRIKLVVSARVDSDKYILDGIEDEWLSPEISGFENPDLAVDAYFDAFKIPANVREKFRSFSSFKNPLFLYIFCTAYKKMPYYHKRKIDHLLVYWYYILDRNDGVSKIIDEDPIQNKTADYLVELAKESVHTVNCDVIDRKVARKIADQMSILPGWKHNLLYACEKENLLRMTYRDNQSWKTAYEFENLGDFLKAKIIYDEVKGKPHTELLDEINQRLAVRTRTQDLTHVIESVLSIYDSDSPLWGEDVILDGELTNYVLNSLQYHRPMDEFESFTEKVFSGIWNKNRGRISPLFLKEHVLDLGNSSINLLHNELKSLTQNELDAFWTDKVNRLYRTKRPEKELNFSATVRSKEFATNHIILMSWFCASSYPIVRAYAQRALFQDFVNCPDAILDSIRLFKDVKDPYVIQSLYAAVYGFLLKRKIVHYTTEPLWGENEDENIKSIATFVYDTYYSQPELVPQDIVIRFWQLKVLERIAVLFPESNYWNRVKSLGRFAAQPSPMYQGEDAIERDANYFGFAKEKNYGLQNSLCDQGSDFCRYILHMNNTNTSYTYFNDENNKYSGVSMLDVQRSIIHLIKNEIGWNETLASMDNSHSPGYRMYNDKERIGKKYQWMGLYRVEAYLSDTCYMREDYWSDAGVLDKNFPWYSPHRPYFDPALSLNDLEVPRKLSEGFAESKRELTVDVDSVVEWHSKVIDYKQIFKDSDGEEWIPVFLFDIKDSDTELPKEGAHLHQFVFYNSLFCKDADGDRLFEWAKEQDFCGRWMIEPNDSIGFYWNEYPWSESYKREYSEDNLKCQERGCPIELMQSCIGELQENSEGLPEGVNYIATVYAPSPKIMEMFDLYTAERGVVRRVGNDEIVSFNIHSPGSSYSGMLIKKTLLQEYLRRTGQRMFTCLCSEKYGQVATSSIGMKYFTGSYQIDANGQVVCDDKLHNIEPPKIEIDDDYKDDMYDFLESMDDIKAEIETPQPIMQSPKPRKKHKKKHKKRKK